MDWAEEIRRLRRSRMLKQFVLADSLGVNQATVSRWERGKSVPEPGMQRRLRELMRSTVPDEILLRHSVTVALGTVVLSNSQRVVQAVSAGYSRAHGMPQETMPGHSNKGRLGPDCEALMESVRERGFYRGEVASVTGLCRASSLSGHRPPVPVRVVFTPVRVGDEFLLRGEREELSEEQFERELTRNGAPPRFVMTDELIG